MIFNKNLLFGLLVSLAGALSLTKRFEGRKLSIILIYICILLILNVCYLIYKRDTHTDLVLPIFIDGFQLD